jgi:hypothetical protein
VHDDLPEGGPHRVRRRVHERAVERRAHIEDDRSARVRRAVRCRSLASLQSARTTDATWTPHRRRKPSDS